MMTEQGILKSGGASIGKQWVVTGHWKVGGGAGQTEKVLRSNQVSEMTGLVVRLLLQTFRENCPRILG